MGDSLLNIKNRATNSAQEKGKETLGVSLSGKLQFLSLLNDASPRLNYPEIWNLQKNLLEEIASGESPETIIFCEHEKVLTKGRRSKAENVLDASVPCYEIERGGDVTLHHPGQLVIYPLLKLHGEIFKGNLQEYLRFCEQIIIQFLESFGLEAGRFGPTGVWVKSKVSGETKKIASIGISVRRWITYHGISLNVCNDLSEFSALRPCDFDASIMTSLANEGVNRELPEVAGSLRKIISRTLGEK